VPDYQDIWRFQRARHERRLRHPGARDKDITKAAWRQVASEQTGDELADLDAQVIGEEYAKQPDQPDPVDYFKVPDLQRGYKIERRRHPDWSHHHLVNMVLMKIAQDPDAYSKARQAAERRSRTPQRYDSCKSCKFYHKFLEGDLRAGNCGHVSRYGRTVKEEDICEHWHA
jgi:hypothetical protein